MTGTDIHGIPTEIVQAYGLSDAFVTILPGGTANRNYKITSDRGEEALRKRNPKYSGETQLRYEAEYLRHVFAQQVPVPVPIESAAGSLWVTDDVGGVYQLYPYIDGQPFNSQRIEQVEEAGRFLADMHGAAEQFHPETERTFKRYDSPSVMLEIVQRTYEEEQMSDLTPDEKRILDFLIVRLQSLQQQLSDSVYSLLPSAFIHGDYHPANVKYEGDRICGLFDFDWVGLQPRIRDVADGLIYFSGIRSVTLDAGDIFSLTQACSFEFTRCNAFLNAYQSKARHPLESHELACLPLQMTARLINSRVLALPKIPQRRHVEMLTSGMEPPLLWLEEHRHEFYDGTK